MQFLLAVTSLLGLVNPKMNVRQEGSCAHPQLPDSSCTPHIEAWSTAPPGEAALTVLILLLTAALVQAIRKVFLCFILRMAQLQQ